MSNLEVHKLRASKGKGRLYIGLLLAIVMIITSTILLVLHFNSNEFVTYFEKDHPIIYQGQIAEEEAFIQNETIYLPLSFVTEHIDDSIVFDQQSSSIILTTEDKVLQLPTDSLQYFVNEAPLSLEVPVFISENGSSYVNLAPLDSIYPFNIHYSEETGAVQVEKIGEHTLTAVVKEEYESKQSALRVRSKPNRYTSYVADVVPGEVIDIEGDVNGYYLIRKENGIAGYLRKDVVELLELRTTIELPVLEEDRLSNSQLSWPINLTWEAVYSKNPDTSGLLDMQGLNVVSPTWFSIKNNEGDIRNLASMDYVHWAKNNGYQIWAVFSNDFDPDKTHHALKDFETRQRMIRQLVQYAAMYELDGINIDFENVNVVDRDVLTQFVKELTVYLHQAGVIVSMDITFISSSENWSMFYDREKLATIVDYLIVMAYDEHWATSPIAGSVASLPWVESNLTRLLEVIPNERLILGIPTYTRIWKEQETPGGNIEVSSKAYGMDSVHSWIAERGLTPSYDDKTGQDYVSYTDEKEKATYKIWIENERSLRKRTQLVHKYNLAGIASWNRSFANETVWGILDESLRQLEPVHKNVN